MRKILFLSFLFALGSSAQAQVARWVVHPVYDHIQMAKGAPLLLCDSLDTKVLFDESGNRLAVTSDSICDFREGKAVTMKKGTDFVTGFFDTQGHFTPLGGDYSVTYGYPYFSDGHLLLQQNGQFYFADSKGRPANFGYFVKMLPFFHGFSACYSYENLEKMKSPFYNYVRVDNGTVDYKLDGKFYPLKQVKLVSSINDEGIGIVLLKKKVFLYHTGEMTLERLFADPAETNEKRQVELDDDLEKSLQKEGEGHLLLAECGKDAVAKIHFDPLFRPVRIEFPNRTINYKTAALKERVLTSDLEALRSSKAQLGLLYKGNVVLPEQFDDVSMRFGNKAVVCSKGKWGILEVVEAPLAKVTMNKGNDIAFRHQKFETSIRLDLPTLISAEDCRFDVAPQTGCQIDKTSYRTRNTESGNFVEYNCVLTIPDSLPDVLTEIVYPVKVTYDGLEMPQIDLKVKAWHYKYITLNLNDEELVFKGQNAAFSFDLVAEKRQGEGDYPLVLEVKTSGAMMPELEKISETRYTCKTYNLEEGVNDLVVRILENGCPPMEVPLEVIYTKAAPKHKENGEMVPATKESVVVRKKGDVVLDQPDELKVEKIPGGEVTPVKKPEISSNNDEQMSGAALSLYELATRHSSNHLLF